MPDITLPNTFTDANVLEAADVSENVYYPKSTPDNLEVINGRLDITNLPATPNITRPMVRREASATAITRGHTASTDFFQDFYKGDYLSQVTADAIEEGQVVVGVTFDVPYDCTLVYLSWHIGLIVDAGYIYSNTAGGVADADSDNDGVPDFPAPLAAANLRGIGTTSAYLSVDGVARKEMLRRFQNGFTTMLGQIYYGAGNNQQVLPGGGNPEELWNDPLAPDHRWWSGHTIVDFSNKLDFIGAGSPTFLSKGRHTADIRVTLGNWVHSVSAQKLTVRQVKFKTCRITAIPVR